MYGHIIKAVLLQDYLLEEFFFVSLDLDELFSVWCEFVIGSHAPDINEVLSTVNLYHLWIFTQIFIVFIEYIQFFTFLKYNIFKMRK